MAREQSAAQRYRIMTKKYYNAYQSSRVVAGSNYIIKAADDTYEKFYVLFMPQSMLYRSQEHIILIETMYDNGRKCYPRNCPNVTFLTAIYHTNISTGGDVCVDFLTDSQKWSPVMELSNIIASIELLLEQPNVDSPYNCDASNDYKVYSKQYAEAAAALESKGTTDEKSLSELRESVFAPLKVLSDCYAEQNKSILFKFIRYFPSLDSAAAEAVGAYTGDPDYAELIATYERLYPADKKSTAAAVDDQQKKLALLEQLRRKSKK